MSILVSEAELLSQIEGQAARLNDPATLLRLVRSDISPTSLTTLAEFPQASYAGYAPLPTRHMFREPTRVAEGIYELSSNLFNFFSAANPLQVIYAWLITLGDDWLFYSLLPSPLAISPGNPLSIGVQVRVYAREVFPCDPEGD